MSKRLLSAALIAGLGLAFVPGANAADGTISFNGRVLAQTCKINNATSPVTLSLNLPWVYAPELTDGETAGDKDFTIAITDCDNALTHAQVSFSSGHLDTTTGYLTQATAGGAQNVQIELLNKDGTALTLNGAAAESKVVDMTGGAANLDFTARYIAVGGDATPGAVTSDVQFTMVYN